MCVRNVTLWPIIVRYLIHTLFFQQPFPLSSQRMASAHLNQSTPTVSTHIIQKYSSFCGDQTKLNFYHGQFLHRLKCYCPSRKRTCFFYYHHMTSISKALMSPNYSYEAILFMPTGQAILFPPM